MNNYDILIKIGDVWQPYSYDDIIIQFTESKTSVKPGEIIYFYNSTWPKPTGITWFFGDGGESNDFNPTWSYHNEGTYSIALIVTYDVGSKSKTFKNYINVDVNNIEPPSPTASIFD
jgi:PKD repeat protein